MSFERTRTSWNFEDRLAQLLSEEPVRLTMHEAANDRLPDAPADLARAWVIALLLTSVLGTWSAALFL
jgi:hypothetical protein